MKSETKKYILTILVLTLFLVVFFAFKPKITGNSINDFTHSYTKAICDENNFCEDYEIICNENKLVKFTPTGFTLQQPDNWKDPRNPEETEELCG